MPQYVVMAYRESGSDYCRGCEMERWGSDFDYLSTTDLEEVEAFYLKTERQDRRHSYWSYEIILLVDGETDSSLNSDLQIKAKSILDKEEAEQKEREKAAEVERKKREKAARDQANELRDLREYERLKVKFGTKEWVVKTEMRVGDHVTLDWDGPSQGVITSLEGDMATVQDDGGRGEISIEVSNLTLGKLQKNENGTYSTVTETPV